MTVALDARIDSLAPERAAGLAQSAALSLKLLTVNTHKGFSFLNRKFILHELREAVRAVSADVVFLQEVLGTHETHATRIADWPLAPHYEFLAETMWPQFAYGRNAVHPHGHHGNALLSKFPIVRYANHDISFTGPEQRGLLHAVIELPMTPSVELHAICVHLGLEEAQRKAQLELLCALVEDAVPAGAPLVVAGDFNDWRMKADRVLDRAGLREVFVACHGRAAKTFPARWPLLRLDRIYVRGAQVHEPIVLPRAPWSHLSDHTPLAAEITL